MTQRLLAAIEADENRIAAWAITLLLLTGARRNEVTHAKWEYLNWDRRTLLVPLSKSGKPRTITLNAHALDLLRSVRRIDGNPYIFPSEITDKPCASLHFPWDRIRRRAGLVDVRLHDLRHSFASFLVNQGISLYVVQGLLGHSHSRTTQRYAHLAQQTLQNAAEVVGLIVSSGTQSAEVVPQSHNSSGALSRKMRPDLADTEANVTRNTACIDQPAREISGDGREVKPAGPSEK